MRILVGADVPPDTDGGASGTVVHTNRALKALGHDVDPFWAADVGRRIRHGNVHYAIELPFRYRALVRSRTRLGRYDVVQLSQPHAYLAAREHRQRGRPGVFVNRSHGLELRYKVAMRSWARPVSPRAAVWRSLAKKGLGRLLDSHWRWLTQWTDGIILSSRLDRDFLLDIYPIQDWRVRTIHHGVPDAFCESPARPLDDERLNRLIHIAQYAPVKAPEVTAAIANEVLARHVQLRLSWVAPAAAHPVISGLLNPAVRGRVELLDWRPQGGLMSLLDSHGIFLFPSHFEGAGKACLEALARGLVVISSMNGAMGDYISDGVNGWLLPPAVPHGYVAAIEWALANPLEAAEMGRRAALAGRQYTWTRCAMASVDFYAELAGRKDWSGAASNF